MKKRILFVDNEPGALNGLRRSLRRQHGEWEVEFADSSLIKVVSEENKGTTSLFDCPLLSIQSHKKE